MNKREKHLIRRHGLTKLTWADWFVIIGATGTIIGLLMSFMTFLSAGTIQFPEYYVNAGRSSFLHMLLGSSSGASIKYYLSVALVGGAVLVIGLVRIKTAKKHRNETQRQPNQAL
jgi:hypothetical protein